MVAFSPASSPAYSPARRATDLRGSGSTPWTPGILGSHLLARFLDGQKYASQTLNGLQILQPQEPHGTLRAARQGRVYVADGVDDYIAIASLTGSETVVSSGGTGTPSIAAGRINLTAGTYWDIILSNGSHYPCNEEAGATSYDISTHARHGTITNATLATFHGTSSSRTANRNNVHGYRLSSGVYIPARIGTSLAADGNALTHTGRTPYPATVETPCVTGDGTGVYVNLDSVLSPNLTNPWKVQATFKLNSTASTQTIVFIGDGTRSITIQYRVAQGFQCAFLNGVFFGPSAASLAGAADGNWHTITMEHFGSNVVQVELDGVVIANGTPNPDTGALLSARLLHRSTGSSLANIADFKFTDNGITKHFPLQDGPGTSNTNRNIGWVASDGTSGVISNAIVGGTVSAIWANRCPGYVRDHCIEHGGRVATYQNLLRWSEDFTNSAWSKQSTTVEASDENGPPVLPWAAVTKLAIDGGTPSSSFGRFVSQNVTVTGRQTIYAKASAAVSDLLVDQFDIGGGSNDDRHRISVDLTTGVASAVTGGVANALEDVIVTSVGGGWYRVEVTSNFTSIANLNIRFGTNSECYVSAPSYTTTSNLPPYQPTTSAATETAPFIPGKLDGSGAADGNALTLLPGKHGNPYSTLNTNPFNAAEANGRNWPTALVPGASLGITPSNSAFRRTAADGDDRFFVADDTLTGTDLTNAEGYVE